MEISKLNENPIVFYESTMKTLLKDEERTLGNVQYANSYGQNNLAIKANIVYVNKDGIAMLANDYFYNKGLKTFGGNDGVSAGYMIDNWGPGDMVNYSEKPVPEGFEKKLKSVNFETAGYSKAEFEEDIDSLVDKMWETDNYADLALELGFKLAKYYITARSGETMERKDYEHNWEDSIPLANEDEALRSMFPLNNGGVVCKIKILDSEEKGPRVELETEKDKELTMANLTKEGVVELVDLLEEQAFYGPTTV